MEEIPKQLSQGIDQFNRGEYYACHDTLEDIWMEAIEPDRSFLQGILQVAVGLYHLTNHNWQGAVTLLGNGIRRLHPYAPSYGGVDVEHLLEWSTELLQSLQLSGPEAVQKVAQRLPKADLRQSMPEKGASERMAYTIYATAH
ncbi:MAG: DUF309 domain-containing protein [Elainellaceae cyanobacterium]